MAVADGKKRVVYSLDEESLRKLEELYQHERKHNKPAGQFTSSNVLQMLIDARYDILKKFGE